jgi:hypothetical protein
MQVFMLDLPQTLLSSMPFAAEFLRQPRLFPEGAAGEPWGKERICLTLVGGLYRFSGVDLSQKQAITAHFGLLSNAQDDQFYRGLDIRVLRAAPDCFRPVDFTGSDYRFDVDHGPAGVRIAGQGFMARLDWTPALSLAIWVAHSGDLLGDGRLENVLRLAVAYHLLEMGGVLLHSAGVVHDGRAWIFPARSGSGKSTLARLSLAEGQAVLSDDMNAIVPAGAGWAAEKLPFAGDLGPTRTDAARYPLAGYCRLRKGEVNAIEPLAASSGIALLIACSPYVNADPFRTERLIDTLEAIAAGVGRAAVSFRREGGLWDLLRREGPAILRASLKG